ncbi:valine--tRNA ligase [Candidatus Gottesmanbacteria bacterium]|nr:valine--tRNA ligase [Candidatus Gottesmanbacteria bacterium]
MDKTYNPQAVERSIYKMWESGSPRWNSGEAGGYFSPKKDSKKKPYTIIMPPPNANDPLHIGHAMFVTVEDILIRYHRMREDATLWLPGTDHAGIETQFLFEKKLKKEGKSRFNFDRKTLYTMIWEYVQENSGIAVTQMKRLGASADWSRFKFTLDPEIVKLVLKTFTKLHEENLVYRDYRLVNYCTHCGTGFSQLEVLHETRHDPLLYLKYGDFTIATVRPETKFRDTALAVNPKDKRYKKYIGQTFTIMGLLGPVDMTVIADPEVDPEFGTGIMKVTPAHDFHDYELGKQHNLRVTPIIDLNGKMDFSWFLSRKDFSSLPQKYQKRAKEYHGLHVNKARPLMIQHLKDDGLLVKTDENYEHTVALCYRCKSLLEPLPLVQFFVRVKPLAERVLEGLKKKDVKIHGPGYDKILNHWLINLKDWNISRQIVWGIRIPAWYEIDGHDTHIAVSFIDENKVMHQGTLAQLLEKFSLSQIQNGLQQIYAMETVPYTISAEEPKDGKQYIPETSTFDTWFSSGQWPVATLKTSRSGDFDKFYPTSVMETAYDILIFWVMRMLMFGYYLTGKPPFAHVYLHGLVRDEKGQKMSKSKGNVLNPIDVIEKYGADALRMALVMSTTAGKDSNTGETKIRGMRNLTNKIWNAARYVLSMPENSDGEKDRELAKDLQTSIKTMTERLDKLRVGLAAEWIYYWFWHVYCDRYIEISKKGFVSKRAMLEALEVNLKLLHPFMPFVTEEIWSKLPRKSSDPLIISSWPISVS